MSNKLTFVSNYYMSRRVGGIMFYLYFICECNFVIPSQLVSKKVNQKHFIVGTIYEVFFLFGPYFWDAEEELHDKGALGLII